MLVVTLVLGLLDESLHLHAQRVDVSERRRTNALVNLLFVISIRRAPSEATQIIMLQWILRVGVNFVHWPCVEKGAIPGPWSEYFGQCPGFSLSCIQGKSVENDPLQSHSQPASPLLDVMDDEDDRTIIINHPPKRCLVQTMSKHIAETQHIPNPAAQICPIALQ